MWKDFDDDEDEEEEEEEEVFAGSPQPPQPFRRRVFADEEVSKLRNWRRRELQMFKNYRHIRSRTRSR